MADVPGVPDTDVYFGDPDAPLPNWRDDPARSEPLDDDAESSEEDRATVAGMIGFDPAELDDAEPAAD